MSLTRRRVCGSIDHDVHRLLHPSPSPAPRTTAHTSRPFCATTTLERGPSKSSVALAREGGLASSFRTKKLAGDIIKQAQPYPLSMWGANSWTQVQIVKMGVPGSLGRDAIEYMFFGQLYQESPKMRVDFWVDERGKWSPSRGQEAEGRRQRAEGRSCEDFITSYVLRWGVNPHY